ncbi:MAG: hypothetical protein ACYCSF_07130 [Acidimicrobiales bacterium]
MLVLVLLAIVWVAALTPIVLRKLREREVVTSVTSFNRQLLRLSGGPGRGDTASSVPGAAIGFSAAARRLAGERGGSDLGAITWGSGTGVPSAAELGPLVSRATTIRRRRVVASLGLGTIVTFLLGFGVSTFFYLAVGGLLASVAYLGLLAYFHRLAVERAQKVVALETRRGAAMALDEARHHTGAIPASTTRPRVGGSCWSVADGDLDAPVQRELVSAGR